MTFGHVQFNREASDRIGSGCEGDIGLGAVGPLLSAGPSTGCQIHISFGSASSAGPASPESSLRVTGAIGVRLKSTAPPSNRLPEGLQGFLFVIGSHHLIELGSRQPDRPSDSNGL